MRNYIKVFIAGALLGAAAGLLYSRCRPQIRQVIQVVDESAQELRQRAGQTVETLRDRFLPQGEE